MAEKVIYSNQTGPTLPTGEKLYFRTVTSYTENQSRQVSNKETSVYYTAIPGGRAKNGDVWTPGSPTGESFNSGGFVKAAVTTDGGKTFQLLNYTQDDADAGRIPSGKNVGDPVLGAAAVQSLTTRGQVLNEAIQNSVINTAVETRPGLAPQLAAKLQNTSQTTPQGDQQGGNPQTQSQGGGTTTPTGNETPSPVDLPEPSQIQPIDIGSNELVLGTPLKISSGSGIRYPLKMVDDQDKIKFLAVEITRSADSIDGQPIYNPVDGPIFLSIQAPITDQNSVGWGPDSVNAIEAFLYNKSLEIMKTDPTKAVEGAFKDILDGFTGNKDRIQKFLAGQAAGLNNVLSRTDSAILNPNLELLFQGPQLRPFTFQFKMTAREPDEAVAIKRIIKYFKYHMAVRREQGLFLRAPHVFTIQYLKGMKPQHPGINLISPEDNKKACALTNCSVDYTPLGSYMTNIDDPDPEKNGTMVAYTLSLQFQEITPIYDTDYGPEGGATNHPIGY
jgi:hypothetical protein